jgi:hypothetical protein
MKNDGTAAEQAFEAHWGKVGHVQRFRDLKDLRGLNKGLRLKDFPKPADFVVSSPDVPLHYAEVKSTTSAVSFSFSNIQPGQSAAALMEASKGSGRYIFYIFSFPLGEWFCMTSIRYAKLSEQGVRSAKFEELPKWVK